MDKLDHIMGKKQQIRVQIPLKAPKGELIKCTFLHRNSRHIENAKI